MLKIVVLMGYLQGGPAPWTEPEYRMEFFRPKSVKAQNDWDRLNLSSGGVEPQRVAKKLGSWK